MTEQQLIDEGYVEGKKSFEYISKVIHEEFNWENVHKAMKALDWTWYFGEDEFKKARFGIPDIPTIKNSAFAMLKKAYDENTSLASGGFSAGWDEDMMYLQFSIEMASC